MSTFTEHCSNIVNDYVQTALIIDDQAFFDSSVQVTTTEMITPRAASPHLKAPIKSSNIVTTTDDTLHSFDAKKVTDAFYEKGIIAGLYKPVISNNLPEDEFADTVEKIASRADVIIVDWMLKDKISKYSKALIKRIIEKDVSNGGRLRSIVVYTGEPVLSDLRDELLAYLNESEIINKSPLSTNNDFGITSNNLSISFYNKMDVGLEIRQQPEDSLPDIALKEFSALVDGIIPAFAMKSAATIRENTGRIITKFDKTLDPGFLTHRALLPNPADAEVFMLENFVSYLRNILSITKADSQTLDLETLNKWLEENHENLSNKRTSGEGRNTIELEYSKTELLEILKHGTNKDKAGLYAELEKMTSTKKAISAMNSFEHINKLMPIFAPSSAEIITSSESLSVLSIFRRTIHDINFETEAPYLTQGSLLYDLDSEAYLLCVTPKCDTARVPNGLNFSFSKMVIKELGKSFDLIAPSMTQDNKMVYLSSISKFYDLRHITFKTPGENRILPTKENGNIIFTSSEGLQYKWVGDLGDIEIQKRVSNLVGNLNRVGSDEVEWMRRQG